jgi:hypothetical protein
LSKAKRIAAAIVISVLMLALMAAPAFAFHHGGLSSTLCSNEAAGSPSNDNGQAKEALSAHNPQGLPLPPVGTSGQGKGVGDEHCAAVQP